MSIDYVTIGEITLDDTVLENGQVLRNQSGGGAIYSALAIGMWGHSVGINATAGADFPEHNIQSLNVSGLSTEGVGRVPGWSLRLWMLNEENNKKQQVPKLQSGKLADMDQYRPNLPESYMHAKGYHLAPATTEGQANARDHIRSVNPNALVSLDMLVAPQIDTIPYINGSLFSGIDILSPSIVEIESLFPGKSIAEFIQFAMKFGVHWVAIKMDVRGAFVYDTQKEEGWRIPIYPANVADTTGAGDSFSGGFLEGLCETGDVKKAGLRGTVSASFAVEHQGIMNIHQIDHAEINYRSSWLQDRVESVSLENYQLPHL